MKHQARILSRSELLTWGVLLVLVVFIARLYYLQVIKHDYYINRAREIQVRPLTIIPERGTIYAYDDGQLVPLVLNEKVYTVFVDPLSIKDSKKVASTLREIVGGNLVKDFEQYLRDDSKEIRYRVLAKNVSRAQAEMLTAKKLDGIGLQQDNRRIYPEGQLAAQVLGYVNSEGKGQYGIEEALDVELTGTKGMLQTVTDVRNIPLTIGSSGVDVPAKDGDDLVLTLDRTAQLKAEELLKTGLERAKATKGSIIVMNPQNGQIYAMANYPTYEPASYSKVEDYALFQNNVISAPYENGSVIKALTMGAGLDSGAVTAQSSFDDSSGCTQMDDRRICNVEEDPRTANATMIDTLHYSLNTGVVHILRQMGGGSVNRTARDKLYYYFHDQYRFGQLTGIDLANESRGTVIAPTAVEGNNVRYANMTFGQGMDLTMLQTATAFSAEINGGTYYKPQIVAGIAQADGSVARREPVVLKSGVLSPQASAAARDMIHQGRKLGLFGKNDRDGYIVGGKTGTSQVIDPKTGKYSNENSIGTYLGFGGTDAPQYVIMVKVDDAKLPGYQGTTAAAPIFNEMSNWMIDHLQLAPQR